MADTNCKQYHDQEHIYVKEVAGSTEANIGYFGYIQISPKVATRVHTTHLNLVPNQ